MAVRWTYFTGTTDDHDEADSLLARLGVNDATEATVVAPNDIAVDDAVTGATLANGTAADDKKTPAKGKLTLREKRTLKKERKLRS